MPKQMVTPRIEEVSGVDMPAHLVPGWAVMKDASPETAAILERAEKVAKGIDPDHTSEGNTMPELKIDKAALPVDAVEYIEALEARITKAEAAVVTPSAAALHISDEDAERAEFEKAVASLPESVRKAMIKTQTENAQNKAVLKSLLDEREETQYTAMAKAMSPLPGVKTAELAVTLRKAAHGDKDAFASITKTLGDTAAYLRANDQLTKEIGLDTSSDGGNGPLDELNALAQEMQKADDTLTAEQAFTKAVKNNPDLYRRHLREGE